MLQMYKIYLCIVKKFENRQKYGARGAPPVNDASNISDTNIAWPHPTCDLYSLSCGLSELRSSHLWFILSELTSSPDLITIDAWRLSELRSSLSTPDLITASLRCVHPLTSSSTPDLIIYAWRLSMKRSSHLWFIHRPDLITIAAHMSHRLIGSNLLASLDRVRTDKTMAHMDIPHPQGHHRSSPVRSGNAEVWPIFKRPFEYCWG